MMAAAMLCVAAMAVAVSAEEVLTLSKENFDETVKGKAFIVVEFYAPWCGHCKHLEPEYEKAAVALKGDTSAGREITLAKMDATIDANREIAERYGVGGFPTLKIFSNGDTTSPAEYEGPREAAGIVSYLKKRAGPASKELTTAEEAKALKDAEKVLVVLAGPSTPAWTGVADSLRDSIAFAHTEDQAVISALSIKKGTVTVFRSFDSKPAIFAGKTDDMEAVKKFVDEERVEIAMPVLKGDQEAIKVLFADDSKPVLFLFTDKDKKAVDEFKEAAMGVKGKYLSAYFKADDFPEAFAHFGMDKFIDSSQLPKVLIEDRKTGTRYLMPANAVEKPTVAKFISAYEAGSVEPYLKSEKEPVPNDGPVKVIVGDSFKAKVMDAGTWVFLEAYAPWCGHCKKLAPIWEDLGNAFKDDDKLVIAKIDATANDLPASLNVRGFPTLLLFKGDGSTPHMYDGARDFKAIAAYLEGKTGSKVPADFVPLVKEAPLKFNDFEKQMLQFLATDFQLPWAEDGTTISGLYIAALIVFLLFVAAVALIIAVFSRDPPPPKKETKKEKKEEKKEEPKKDK